MTPWVKALLVLTLGFFALFGGCVALIAAIGHVSLYATADSPASGVHTSDVRTAASSNGIFLIVDVELTNKTKEPARLMTKLPTVVGGNGTAYSTSGDPLHDHFLRGQVQPRAFKRGSLVYDLSPSSVKDAELRVEDLFSDDKGRIPLGL